MWLENVQLETMLLWLTTVASEEAFYIGLFLQNSTNRHSDPSEYQAHAEFIATPQSAANIELVMPRLAHIENNKLDASY
jgi:hypothetical protein